MRKVFILMSRFFNLVKSKKIQNTEGLKELNRINETFINKLGKEEILQRCSEFTFAYPMTDADEELAKSLLKEKGIVIIKNIFSEDDIKLLKEEFSPYLNNFLEYKNKHIKDDSLSEKYIFHNSSKDAQSAFKKAGNSKSVVFFRDGYDQGMIDIFHFDRLLSNNLKCKLKSFFEEGLLKSLVSSINNKVKIAGMSYYFNKSVTSTRGFHVDNFNGVLKAFVYLTDVNDLSDGPYCFVHSHKSSNYIQKANKKISNSLFCEDTEMPYVNVNNIIPILGKKGTVILCNQSNPHRGFPQHKSSQREVLVTRYIF
jgi:antitoxin component YwqK of YwqJK toxin-antitoxin module